jgi:dCMP deaminase
MRLSHEHYFMLIAKVASLRSVCKSRQVGAVLVDSNNYVLATGYNGPAKGVSECNPCRRLGVESGYGLEGCVAVHAESNALLQCMDIRKIDTLYVTISPCFGCLKLLLNTPCKRICYLNTYPNQESEDVWKELGRKWQQVKFPTRARCIVENLSKIAEFMYLTSCFYYVISALRTVA